MTTAHRESISFAGLTTLPSSSGRQFCVLRTKSMQVFNRSPVTEPGVSSCKSYIENSMRQ